MPPNESSVWKFLLPFYIILLITVFSGAHAQVPELTWAKQLGGSGEERSRAIEIDMAGNILTAGMFFLTADFDPGPNSFNLTASGNKDVFISKVNSAGEFVWAKRIGSTLADDVYSLVVDDEGSVFLTGEFRGIVDFDPGPGVFEITAGSSTAAYVLKLNSNGDFGWAKRFGGTQFASAFGFSIDLDHQGNVFTSGRFQGTIDFNPGPPVYNLMYGQGGGIFVSKLSPDGNFIWAKNMGGNEHLDAAFGIAIDPSGNVLTTGEFWGAADFDPGPNQFILTSTGYSDMFISKLGNAGEFIWAKSLGSATPNLISGRSISIDQEGNPSCTGDFRGTVDFDPGSNVHNLISSGDGDCFILKLSALGEFEWAHRIGGSGNQDIGHDIYSDPQGNVYTTGFFNGVNVDLDPGPGTYLVSAISNAFVLKLDASGVFEWATNMGANSSSNPCSGSSIVVDLIGNVFSTGSFYSTVDFAPGALVYNLTSAGGPDVYISNLKESCLTFGLNIVTQPLSQFVNTCDETLFSVGVQGVPPLTYAWYKNDVLIPGANQATYLMSEITMDDDQANIHCVITNCNGEFLITSEAAKLSVINCVFSTPIVALSNGQIEPGETLTVNGTAFSDPTTVSLTIKDPYNENVAEGIPFTTIGNGEFVFELPIGFSFWNGLYTVQALDIVSGKFAAQRSFLVDNQLFDEIEITSPAAGEQVKAGIPFNIEWRDEMRNFLNPEAGFIPKSYQIEISENNGASWTYIKTISAQAYASQVNTFSTQYTVHSTGFIKLRVSDVAVPVNNDVTDLIEVDECSTVGFTTSLEWDPTVTSVFRNPVGLAADGTARIFIKLKKKPSNSKLVNSIQASINTIGNAYTGPALLGKLMYASDHTTYSDIANNANSTSILYPASQENNLNAAEYWFWLVAPDDFTENPDEIGSERQIDVSFEINYTDNSTDNIALCEPVSISRPALVFVHGVLSDPNSWNNATYTTTQNETINFLKSTEWKVFQRINLFATEFFSKNANLLLEKGLDENYLFENSLKSALHRMHRLGFANKRVDYVCHSMGGSVGRTAINEGAEWYSPGVGRFKNYGQGYINKFITINTPHNGSYLADLLIDFVVDKGDAFGLRFFKKFRSLFFIWQVVGEDIIYEAIPGAGRNLQAHSDGKIFGQTSVTNHLISSDIDPNNNLTETLILQNFPNAPDEWPAYDILKFFDINVLFQSYFFYKYSTLEYLSQTDGVVHLSSQLAGKDSSQAINIVSNPTGIGTTSILYGLDKFHKGIQTNPLVGTRVKRLLNAKMSSGYFANTIPANTTPQNALTGNSISTRQLVTGDSIFYRVDTNFIKILQPHAFDSITVDSVISLDVHLKIHNGFQNLKTLFQSRYYSSEEDDTVQAFQINVQPHIGWNQVWASAEYDSSGYRVNHIDTISIYVKPKGVLEDFFVNPDAVSLNPDQPFIPDYNVVYSTFVGQLDHELESISYQIADTNVIQYDGSQFQFVAKDTGTTNIIFTYGGINDTISVYISTVEDKHKIVLCHGSNASLDSGELDPEKTYQWQIDSSGAFQNIFEDLSFTGTDSSTLILTGIPSEWYGFKFKCIIMDSIGSSESETFTLRFESQWTGAISTAWENVSNWNCLQIPNEYTDVLIRNDVSHFPEVNSMASCRKIRIEEDAIVTVKPGFQLHLTGNE